MLHKDKITKEILLFFYAAVCHVLHFQTVKYFFAIFSSPLYLLSHMWPNVSHTPKLSDFFCALKSSRQKRCSEDELVDSSKLPYNCSHFGKVMVSTVDSLT